MKYQITCAHCGSRFLVEAKEGQTIECTCPGCEGTMRVPIPKADKPHDADKDADDYQQGYVPQHGIGQNDDGDDGNGRQRRLALGCLLCIVVIAAAIVAFFALNHTTKAPIEDPYEYVMPDTATIDTVAEPEEQEVTDTVQVHEDKPETEAVPVDTVKANADAETSSDAEAAVSDDAAASGETTKPKDNKDDTKKKDKAAKETDGPASQSTSDN